MHNPLVLDLEDIGVEVIDVDSGAAAGLESLGTGHGMDEVSASILPTWCCSCPCCCCC
jgi:hypothetical protein